MKIRNVLATAGLAAVTALSLSPMTAQAATSDVGTYRAELVAQAQHNAGGASVLSQFDHLSTSDQQKFVDYATDPDILEATLAAKKSVSSSSKARTTDLASGDVKLTVASSAKSSPAKSLSMKKGNSTAGTLYDVRSSYTFSQEILGITVTKLVQEYYYQTQDGNVVASKTCIDSHVNYNAVVAISSNTTHSTWGNHGQCTTIWTGNLVFKGFGIDMDKKQYLEVDGYGVYSTYVVNV